MIINQILNLKKTLLKFENLHTSFDFITINIASPIRIKKWTNKILPNFQLIGNINNSKTINFKTNKPKNLGLFCEKIFGPIFNWICQCGKYKGKISDIICPICKVEFTESRVRRYRMGYIELNYPVLHLWYLKSQPNYLLLLLKSFYSNITLTQLEKIIYFNEGKRKILKSNKLYPFFYLNNNLLTKKKYYRGSELIQLILDSLNLEIEIKKLRFILNNILYLKENDKYKTLLLHRIRILESFYFTKTNPSWIILTVLPVLPPGLRPYLELGYDHILSSDLNQLYENIILKNNQLNDYDDLLSITDVFLIQYKKQLQQSVDSLIDNNIINNEISNNKVLKSLTQMLEGKFGRFRQNLLGKRVDYSGRSVITTNSLLKLNECSLPYIIIAEFLKPIILNQILLTKLTITNIQLINDFINYKHFFIWILLNNLIKNYTILLNRAPTLHRLGLQSFNPIINTNYVIQLHPLLCTGFNADFDGDQMGVYLPLYEKSQFEINQLMKPIFNLLSPSNGQLIIKPTQDILLGCYYLTLMINKKTYIFPKYFYNKYNILLQLFQKKLTLHTPILVHYFPNQLLFPKKLLSLIHLKTKKIDTQLITIYKILKINKLIHKYYILTNFGILIYIKLKNNTYKLISIYLETTPGRILFNFNNNLNFYVYK